MKTKAKRIDRRTRKLKLKGPRSKTYVIRRPYYDLFDTEMLEERDVERMSLNPSEAWIYRLRNKKRKDIKATKCRKNGLSWFRYYDEVRSPFWDITKPFNVRKI